MLFSWYIVGYLFLAGAGSGAFLLSVAGCAYDAVRRTPESERVAAAVQPGFFAAPCLVALSGVLLLLDLGNPERAWAVLSMPLQSVMSAGAWFVCVLAVVSAAVAVMGIACRRVPRAAFAACCAVGGVAAIGAMAYTGLLLSDMVSIDFWHTPWLVVLFVVSSLSTGAACVIGIDAVALPPSRVAPRELWRIAGALCALETIALAAFFFAQSSFTEVSRQSCGLLFAGGLAPAFWCGVVGAGIVVPAVAHAASRRSVSASTAVAASAGVLAGGFALRYCIVAAALFTPILPGVVL